MIEHSLEFRLTHRNLTIHELWCEIAKIAQGRVEGNIKEGSYPLLVRELQLCSIETIVKTIKESHEVMKSIERHSNTTKD